ncbi:MULTISPECIES: transcriptional regulator [Rummeliibacillus]|uniref:transcriptional regulator n=1 Tax=Rummeliibacillus TaxID=648802 RepID=UPI00123AD18B|nr:transcriptional regulator [Rummeliibacillus sp. TYF-LIM-RU47]
MKEQLIKAMQYNQLVDLMYISQNGTITKRRIKLIKIVGDKFQAFCFTKHAKRTFIIDNALAVLPVIQKERREVI